MGAFYVPTKIKAIKKMIDFYPLKKGKLIIELGSGDGRVLREFCQKYNLKGIGYDVNPLLVFWSNFLTKMKKLEGKVKFFRKNAYQVSLKEADYLYLFLMPEMLSKLKKNFEKQLKKGTIVISHAFKIDGWDKKIFKVLKDKPFCTYYYKI